MDKLKKSSKKLAIYNEKYQSLLENPLGTGSFGSVYLVKDILDNKR